MSDEIERLLREVGQTTSPGGSSGSQIEKRRSEVAKSSSAGGRLAFAILMAVLVGAVTWGVGVLLPFVGAVSAGVGGAIGAALCALIAGPPRWFSS